MNLYIKFLLLELSFILGIHAHSWISCTDYKLPNNYPHELSNIGNNVNLSINYDLNNCMGVGRNYQLQYQSDLNRGFGFDTGYNFKGQECKYTYDSNYYKEPLKMAKYIPGSQICLTYPSKNHVAAECTNPFIQDNGVKIYRSINKITDDFKKEYQHLNNNHKVGTIDYLGFQNCPGFCNNMDKTVCYMCFNLESNIEPGIYSFKWIWEFNPQEYYSTCWDAEIINDKNINIDEPCQSRKLSEISYKYIKENLCSINNPTSDSIPSINPTPNSTPVSTPNSTPLSTPNSTPVSTPNSTPVSTIENSKKKCKIINTPNPNTPNTPNPNTPNTPNTNTPNTPNPNTPNPNTPNPNTPNPNTPNPNTPNTPNTNNINDDNQNANIWEQCGGKDIKTKTCKDGICVKYSPYYSQCLPNELEKGVLCGQNNGQEINWIHNKCKNGLSCKQQSNSIDFRCN